MVLVNLVVWFIAILLEYIFPEEIGHSAVPGAIVISAAFCAAATSSSFPRRVWLTGLTGVASTTLILSLYAALKGFRLGMAADETGNFLETILVFTAIYALMLLAIYAIEFAANFFRLK